MKHVIAALLAVFWLAAQANAKEPELVGEEPSKVVRYPELRCGCVSPPPPPEPTVITVTWRL